MNWSEATHVFTAILRAQPQREIVVVRQPSPLLPDSPTAFRLFELPTDQVTITRHPVFDNALIILLVKPDAELIDKDVSILIQKQLSCENALFRSSVEATRHLAT